MSVADFHEISSSKHLPRKHWRGRGAVFSRSVNLISTREGEDYAHHNTSRPPDFRTFLRLCYQVLPALTQISVARIQGCRNWEERGGTCLPAFGKSVTLSQPGEGGIRIFRPSYGSEFRFNLRVTTFGFQLNQDALTTKNSWKSYTQFDIARNDDDATLNNNNMMETATTDAAVSQSTACPVKSRKK